MAARLLSTRQGTRPQWGRIALQADAVIAAAAGAVVAVDSAPLATWTGIARGGLLGVGVFCVAYGLALFLGARAPWRVPGLLAIVPYGNLVWVVASIVGLLLGRGALTTAGSWLVAGQAIVVADLALAQFIARSTPRS